MNPNERHQLELNVRNALRGSLTILEKDGKPYAAMRVFVVDFLDNQMREVSEAHNQVMGGIPGTDFVTRSRLQDQYNQLILGMKNVKGAMLAEIKFREEKNAHKKNQPAPQS